MIRHFNGERRGGPLSNAEEGNTGAVWRRPACEREEFTGTGDFLLIALESIRNAPVVIHERSFIATDSAGVLPDVTSRVNAAGELSEIAPFDCFEITRGDHGRAGNLLE